MAQDILLEAKNLVKDYKEGKIVTSVLKGVNLSIQENELVSVVGSSGSGKSTLLHILGTLDTQTSGEVLFRGEDLSKLSQKKLSEFRSKNLGFVYQFHHLLSDFTAYENVAIPLMINCQRSILLIIQKLKLKLNQLRKSTKKTTTIS